MIELFKGVEALKQESLLIADKLGNPDVLANESLYQQTLTRYDDLQEQLNKMNAYGYEGEIRSVLHGFQFYPEDYDKPIQQLSGGQRTRLALAKILLEKHDVLILDEPTNHLDIETLTWLEDYLKSSPVSLLIVSHDQYFLDKVCQEVYEFIITLANIIRAIIHTMLLNAKTASYYNKKLMKNNKRKFKN